MKASVLSLFALPAIVAAQNFTFLASLAEALNSLGLIQTLNATISLNNTATGLEVLANISSGNPFLIFAPTDDACTLFECLDVLSSAHHHCRGPRAGQRH